MAQTKDEGADKAIKAKAGDTTATPNVSAATKPTAVAKSIASPKPEVAPEPKTEPVAAKVPEAVAAKPAPKAEKPVKRTYKPRLKASVAKAAVAKPIIKKTARKSVAKKIAPKPVAQKAAVVAAVAAPAPKIAAVAPEPAKKPTKIVQEFVKMNTPENFAAGLKNAMSDITLKSKEAFEKSTGMMSGASEFTKGNVEAMVEASKIFATGMQELSRSLVADSKAEFEAITSEVKELASVKSPTDFFQLQSAMMRKYFDKSVAAASKNTEAMLKLANDAAQPLSSRVSVAMEKMKAA
ncbi:phasin family protein [Croceicoccus ponticola]|uniref:Phasin family protein n=1 Tax=Croceicoccus ponticola TaxID=2217664 RepID=A0A437GXG2_9SPHN|nr:phasin family protein [Croceicoccus ponticola]RVQ67098.1 phasin family protein [Croceicoccus ponticola]